MLKLINITKEYYLKDQDSVKALKGINLSFRKSEFVAVLGHSGCGKTTLLNIIGGLDHYTSGDLIIEGKSTKQYSDYDWDTYRNHSIGFVFQSYNLIPHQNLLQNVELALTISGVSRAERERRAKEALAKVGLEGLEKKKPNQLSGGQMQRVAIARALVNNPEILLADEPTGALDSETSVQIMKILKEVAKDRLVIMVTHNPDLANEYATRIVRMSDGLIIDDSDPYESTTPLVDAPKKQKDLSKGSKAKTSMSFGTACGLSMSNLIAKLRRTILVMIAGSIGIIGVASVLAVSHGVNNYIDNMQNDMLSSYPVSISEETIDYTSLMTGLNNYDKKELLEFDTSTRVGLDSMINYLMSTYQGFTSTKTNDISKEYVDYIKAIPQENVAVTMFDYGIDVTNNIFTTWNSNHKGEKSVISLNGLTQSYIAELKTVDGFSDYASYVDLFTDFMVELPNNKDYILDQYELLGDSKYAEAEDEIMLVVDSNTTLTDLVLAQLGFFDHDEFLNIAKLAIKQNEEESELKDDELTREQKQAIYDKLVEEYPYRRSFGYDELLNKELYYYPHDTIYSYGNIVSSVTDSINVILTSPTEMITLAYDEATDRLQGILIDLATSSYSICYLQRTGEVSESPDKADIIRGAWVGILGDMNHYIILNLNDPNGSANMAWKTDNPMSLDITSTFPTFYDAQTSVTPTQTLIDGYKYSATIDDPAMLSNPATYNGKKLKIVGILRAKEGTSFGCLSRGVYYTKAFGDKYIEDSINSEIITDPTHGFKSFVGSEDEKSHTFNAYVTFKYNDWTDEDNVIERDGYASSLNGDLSSSFSNLFASLTGVNYAEQDQTYLRSLCGLKILTDNETGEKSFELLPQNISIYPWDFEAKDNITAYLDAWNDNEEHSEITYSDTIAIIIAVIDSLINAITIALVAFTSLSLVVSCFMIAVITYISVMERIKEIGVIRSLGGRKKDVSRLFIAENLITGLLSGVFGVIMSYVVCIIINAVVAKYHVGNIGSLTPVTAIIMVCLSIFLSVVSGLIPSMKASHEDPVLALRSE